MLKPKVLPEGNYTHSELVNEGILVPGKHIKINGKIYLAIGGNTVTKLIDLQSNIKYDTPTIITGKISVSELAPHEIQQVKQVYDSYKTGEQIIREINKGTVDSVSFKKGSVISLKEDAGSGLSTQAILETSDSIFKKERLSNGSNPIKLHEAKQLSAVINYSEVDELKLVLDTEKNDLDFKQIQLLKKKLKNRGQDNIANTLEVFEQIKESSKNKDKSLKSLVSEVIEKSSSGESRVVLNSDINANKYSNVVFTKDVSKSVEDILKTHKTASSLNPKKSTTDATFNKYDVFTNDATDKALKFSKEFRETKDVKVKIAEVEFQKFSQNAITDQRRNAHILDTIYGRAEKIDTKLGTNLRTRMKDNIHLYSEVKNLHDLGFVGIGNKSSTSAIKNASFQFQQIQNLQDGLKIGYNGNVISTNSGDSFVAQNIIKNQTLDEFYNSHIQTDKLFKTIKDSSPENINKVSKTLFNKKAGHLERYPSNIRNQTGLLAITTGIVGTYFYQQMITSAALKARRTIESFIQPSEIIEAKRHSSVETSARRILSTDFGGAWSALNIIIKDLALSGRTSAQQFISASKTPGKIDMLRGAYDDVVKKTTSIQERTLSSYSEGSKNLIKYITKGGITEDLNEGLKYVAQNKKTIGLVTGSTVLFSRLGSNEWYKNTEESKILEKKYRGAHYKDYLKANEVRPDDWRDSLTRIDSVVNTGFGSPWALRKSLGLILAGTSKTSKIFTLAHKSAKGLGDDLSISGSGFQMEHMVGKELSMGTQRAISALSKEIDIHVLQSFYSKKSADALSTLAVQSPKHTMTLNKEIGTFMSMLSRPSMRGTKEFTQQYQRAQRSVASLLIHSQKKQIDTVLKRRIDFARKVPKLKIPEYSIDGFIVKTNKYNPPRFKVKTRQKTNITKLSDEEILVTRKSDIDPNTLKTLAENGHIRIGNKNRQSRFIEVSFFNPNNKPRQVVAVTNTGKKMPEVIADTNSPASTAVLNYGKMPEKKVQAAQIGERINETVMDRNVVTNNRYANGKNLLSRL